MLFPKHNLNKTRIDVYETLCRQQMLVHKGGWGRFGGGGGVRVVGGGGGVRVDVNEELKFL